MPTPNEVYAASTCFLCYGMTMAQALKLGLLKLQALSLDPAADVTPETLLANASCYNCYANGNIYDLLELALLALISELECTPGGDGLIWGPTPENAASIAGSADAFNQRFPGDTYTTFSFGNPVNVAGDIDFSSSSIITELEFRLLETVGGSFIMTGSGVMTTVTANSLISVGADLFLDSMISLASFNFNSLQTVGGGIILDSSTAITSVTFPALTSVDNISLNAATVTFFSAPLLAAYPPTGINDFGVLETLSIPSCVDDDAGQLNTDLSTMTALVTLNIAAMVTITANLVLTASPNMTLFTANAWLPTDGTTIDFTGCSLDAASVNLILARCIAGGVTTCTINLAGGTNAAPTGQGVIDKGVLIGLGNTVNTN